MSGILPIYPEVDLRPPPIAAKLETDQAQFRVFHLVHFLVLCLPTKASRFGATAAPPAG